MSRALSRRGLLAASVLLLCATLPAQAAGTTLLNVSYDVAREFYKDFNAAFAAPWNIRDWSNLGRPGVGVIIPNPKTSGNGRYTYLAAWGAGIKAGLSPEAAKALVTRIFGNVPVLDGGGRGATTTFAQRNLGDALVTFESEVPLIKKEFSGGFEVIYPSRTVLAENPVSVVDKVVDKKGTRKQAEAYLQFLYTDVGQEVAAKHNIRPRSEKVLASYAKAFPKVNTFTVDEVFGGWTNAQKDHFNDGALYDKAIAAAKAR